MIIFGSLRLKAVMKVQSLKLSTKDLTFLNLVGYFFNNFLPTSIGGDLVRAHYVSKRTGKRLESVSSIVVDRLFGFATLMLITIVALFLMKNTIAESFGIWLAVALIFFTTITWLVLGNNKISQTLAVICKRLIPGRPLGLLRRFHHTIHQYRSHKRSIAVSISWALGMHMVIILINYLYAVSLHIDVPFLTLFSIIPLTSFASMFPSINGLGVREGAYVYFLTGTLQPEMAFALSLMWLFTLISLGVVGGLLYLMGAGLHNPEPKHITAQVKI